MGVLPLALSPSPPSLASLRWLMAAVVLSRTGLWACDIAATQIMQLGVTPSSALGTVSGVQGSVCAACELLAYAAGLCVSQPSSFSWLMFASLAAVASATGIYWRYSFTRQLSSSPV